MYVHRPYFAMGHSNDLTHTTGDWTLESEGKWSTCFTKERIKKSDLEKI